MAISLLRKSFLGFITLRSVLFFTSVMASASSAAFYPIGTHGTPWGEAERVAWKAQTKIQRSYQEEVLDKLDEMKETMVVEQYGSLPHDPDRYPLFAVKTHDWQADKPHILVTGGVHGYETSGVQGALRFLQTKAQDYAKHFNIVVAPCVSPWAYERIQRWQADSEDPNRSFQRENQTDESKAIMNYLDQLNVPRWTCHVDLHETTDTDATEFRPARQAKAGLTYTPSGIPDGFYLVGDSTNPQLEFQQAIIDSVRKVTHIAPPDNAQKNTIIGEPVVQEGVILVPTQELGLCGGVTGGLYTATTEVYPDSRATDEICNQAQVAAVVGALDYILSQQECSTK